MFGHVGEMLFGRTRERRAAYDQHNLTERQGEDLERDEHAARSLAESYSNMVGQASRETCRRSSPPIYG